MPDDLYERDVLAWSEHQAGLLRRMEGGERVNTLDWANVIEEIESVGLRELRACEAYLRQALVHLLKARAWPDSRSAAQWREEIREFLDSAQEEFSPSMRQRIDLSALYRKALRRAREARDDSGAGRPLPEECPFALDDIVSETAEVAQLLSKLESPSPSGRGPG